MNRKIQILKAVTTFIVGMGTSKIAADVITNNTDTESMTDKVTVTVAGTVIGVMAAERTRSWTDAKIDEVYARWTASQTN